MQEGLVADDVGEVVYLSEELRLDLFYVLLVPHLRGHQRGPDVDEDAAGEGAGQGVFDVHVHLLQPLAEEAEVALYGFLSKLALLLKLHVDWYAEVLNLLHARHALNVRVFVLC